MYGFYNYYYYIFCACKSEHLIVEIMLRSSTLRGFVVTNQIYIIISAFKKIGKSYDFNTKRVFDKIDFTFYRTFFKVEKLQYI